METRSRVIEYPIQQFSLLLVGYYGGLSECFQRVRRRLKTKAGKWMQRRNSDEIGLRSDGNAEQCCWNSLNRIVVDISVHSLCFCNFFYTVFVLFVIIFFPMFIFVLVVLVFLVCRFNIVVLMLFYFYFYFCIADHLIYVGEEVLRT